MKECICSFRAKHDLSLMIQYMTPCKYRCTDCSPNDRKRPVFRKIDLVRVWKSAVSGYQICFYVPLSYNEHFYWPSFTPKISQFFYLNNRSHLNHLKIALSESEDKLYLVYLLIPKCETNWFNKISKCWATIFYCSKNQDSFCWIKF